MSQTKWGVRYHTNVAMMKKNANWKKYWNVLFTAILCGV